MKYDGMTREQLVEELTEAHRLVSDLLVQAADLREAVKELRTSEERYRLYFSQSNDVMFSYDLNLSILRVSPNLERVLGYQPEELVGRYFYDLGILHPADLSDAMEDALTIITGRASYRTIHRFFAKDGSVRFGEVCILPFEEKGAVTEIISVARDITDRIEREQRVKVSQETAKALLDASTDSSLVLDAAGNVVAANETAAQRFGKDAKEIMGTHIFGHIPSRASKDVRTAFERVVKEAEPVQLVAKVLGWPLMIRMYPIKDAQGRVSRVAVNAKKTP